MQSKEKIYNILRQKGLRITEQKKIILDVFFENSDKMLSVGDIYNSLSKTSGIDNATIYRNVQKFLSLGILETLLDTEGVNRYAFLEEEHHHYLICTECGKVIRFPCTNHYWDSFAKQNNFEEQHHKLEVYGKCSECKDKIK